MARYGRLFHGKGTSCITCAVDHLGVLVNLIEDVSSTECEHAAVELSLSGLQDSNWCCSFSHLCWSILARQCCALGGAMLTTGCALWAARSSGLDDPCALVSSNIISSIPLVVEAGDRWWCGAVAGSSLSAPLGRQNDQPFRGACSFPSHKRFGFCHFVTPILGRRNRGKHTCRVLILFMSPLTETGTPVALHE